MKAVAGQAIKSLGKVPGLGRILWNGGQYLEELESEYLSPQWQDARVYDYFTNSNGVRIPLVTGIRDQIKPGWQAMLHPHQPEPPPDVATMAKRMAGWHEKFHSVNSFLDTFSVSIGGKSILEIGAYDGVTACMLAESGAQSVLGIDIAAYYLNQAVDESVNPESVESKNRELEDKRNAYRKYVGDETGSKVSFMEADICTSSIPSDSIDIIFSWEVLEHVTDPARAFSEMHRILRKGGIAFHEYNPFFSLSGGHSLCTLDFLWGHARLTDADFEGYLEGLRPAEKSVALSFYRNNLNRMAQADLQCHINDAGFSPLSILPWPRRKHLKLVSREILSQCNEVYPQTTISDLISPFVWVLLRKQ